MRGDDLCSSTGILVGLSGYAQAGKNTVGDILEEQHGFKQLSFAAALKDVAYGANPVVGLQPKNTFYQEFREFVHLRELVDVYGWEQAKHNPEVRLFLQHLGTEGCRKVFGEDVWLGPVEKQILESKWVQGIAVTDVRFPNEAKLIKHLGGVVCRVSRPGLPAPTDHISEHALDDWTFDYTFTNNGTIEDLRLVVECALGL